MPSRETMLIEPPVRLDPSLLAALAAFCEAGGWSQAEAIELLLWAGLGWTGPARASLRVSE